MVSNVAGFAQIKHTLGSFLELEVLPELLDNRAESLPCDSFSFLLDSSCISLVVKNSIGSFLKVNCLKGCD